ncbi:MAG: glycosyltransferase, partial [Candidatus Omnitrophica bacterium]|nr:glycosyltransferase [Candidatus Omnitrophota bacterium]
TVLENLNLPTNFSLNSQAAATQLIEILNNNVMNNVALGQYSSEREAFADLIVSTLNPQTTYQSLKTGATYYVFMTDSAKNTMDSDASLTQALLTNPQSIIGGTRLGRYNAYSTRRAFSGMLILGLYKLTGVEGAKNLRLADMFDAGMLISNNLLVRVIRPSQAGDRTARDSFSKFSLNNSIPFSVRAAENIQFKTQAERNSVAKSVALSSGITPTPENIADIGFALLNINGDFGWSELGRMEAFADTLSGPNGVRGGRRARLTIEELFNLQQEGQRKSIDAELKRIERAIKDGNITAAEAKNRKEQLEQTKKGLDNAGAWQITKFVLTDLKLLDVPIQSWRARRIGAAATLQKISALTKNRLEIAASRNSRLQEWVNKYSDIDEEIADTDLSGITGKKEDNGEVASEVKSAKDATTRKFNFGKSTAAEQDIENTVKSLLESGTAADVAIAGRTVAVRLSRNLTSLGLYTSTGLVEINLNKIRKLIGHLTKLIRENESLKKRWLSISGKENVEEEDILKVVLASVVRHEFRHASDVADGATLDQKETKAYAEVLQSGSTAETFLETVLVFSSSTEELFATDAPNRNAVKEMRDALRAEGIGKQELFGVALMKLNSNERVNDIASGSEEEKEFNAVAALLEPGLTLDEVKARMGIIRDAEAQLHKIFEDANSVTLKGIAGISRQSVREWLNEHLYHRIQRFSFSAIREAQNIATGDVKNAIGVLLKEDTALKARAFNNIQLLQATSTSPEDELLRNYLQIIINSIITDNITSEVQGLAQLPYMTRAQKLQAWANADEQAMHQEFGSEPEVSVVSVNGIPVLSASSFMASLSKDYMFMLMQSQLEFDLEKLEQAAEAENGKLKTINLTEWVAWRVTSLERQLLEKEFTPAQRDYLQAELAELKVVSAEYSGNAESKEAFEHLRQAASGQVFNANKVNFYNRAFGIIGGNIYTLNGRLAILACLQMDHYSDGSKLNADDHAALAKFSPADFVSKLIVFEDKFWSGEIAIGSVSFEDFMGQYEKSAQPTSGSQFSASQFSASAYPSPAALPSAPVQLPVPHHSWGSFKDRFEKAVNDVQLDGKQERGPPTAEAQPQEVVAPAGNRGSLAGKTIVTVSHNFTGTGGVETYLPSLLRRLAETNDNLTIILVYPEHQQFMTPHDQRVGNSMIRYIPSGNTQKEINNTLNQVTQQHNVSLIVTHVAFTGEGNIAVDFAYRNKIPSIVYWHGGQIMKRLIDSGQEKVETFNHIINVFRKATRVAVVSEAGRGQMEYFGLSGDVVGPMVELVHFDPASADGQKIRSMLGLGKKTVILAPNRIYPEKGSLDLLQAAAKMKQQNPNSDFVIVFVGTVNKDSYMNEMKQFIIDNNLSNNVVIHDAVTQGELKDWYAAADVVALPTYAEGLPLVMLEAQLMEKPIIAYSIDGTPEAMQHGKTGIIIDLLGNKNKIDDLALALGRLTQDDGLRESMGKAGRQFVFDTFNPDSLVDRHSRLYAETIGIAAAPVELLDEGGEAIVLGPEESASNFSASAIEGRSSVAAKSAASEGQGGVGGTGVAGPGVGGGAVEVKVEPPPVVDDQAKIAQEAQDRQAEVIAKALAAMIEGARIIKAKADKGNLSEKDENDLQKYVDNFYKEMPKNKELETALKEAVVAVINFRLAEISKLNDLEDLNGKPDKIIKFIKANQNLLGEKDAAELSVKMLNAVAERSNEIRKALREVRKSTSAATALANKFERIRKVRNIALVSIVGFIALMIVGNILVMPLLTPAGLIIGLGMFTSFIAGAIFLNNVYFKNLYQKNPGQFINSGIYRYLKHPIHTSLQLATLGFLVALPSIATFITVAAVIGLIQIESKKEEAELDLKSNGAYSEWAKKVSLKNLFRVKAGLEAVAPKPAAQSQEVIAIALMAILKESGAISEATLDKALGTLGTHLGLYMQAKWLEAAGDNSKIEAARQAAVDFYKDKPVALLTAHYKELFNLLDKGQTTASRNNKNEVGRAMTALSDSYGYLITKIGGNTIIGALPILLPFVGIWKGIVWLAKAINGSGQAQGEANERPIGTSPATPARTPVSADAVGAVGAAVAGLGIARGVAGVSPALPILGRPMSFAPNTESHILAMGSALRTLSPGVPEATTISPIVGRGNKIGGDKQFGAVVIGLARSVAKAARDAALSIKKLLGAQSAASENGERGYDPEKTQGVPVGNTGKATSAGSRNPRTGFGIVIKTIPSHGLSYLRSFVPQVSAFIAKIHSGIYGSRAPPWLRALNSEAGRSSAGVLQVIVVATISLALMVAFFGAKVIFIALGIIGTTVIIFIIIKKSIDDNENRKYTEDEQDSSVSAEIYQGLRKQEKDARSKVLGRLGLATTALTVIGILVIANNPDIALAISESALAMVIVIPLALAMVGVSIVTLCTLPY